MTTKLSSKGQIVLPVSLRKKLALQPGDELSLSFEAGQGEGRIILRPRKIRRHRMKIVIDPITKLPALKGPPGTPKLTSEMVKELLADFP